VELYPTERSLGANIRDVSDVSAADPAVSAFQRLVAASGRVRDALVDAAPDSDVFDRCTALLDQVADALGARIVVPGAEDLLALHNPDPRFGVRTRGLVPHHVVEDESGQHLEASVCFERHFDGVGAVHGGSLTMLFDDALGRLANNDRRLMARTACLKVDFRRPVPWGRPLRLSCRLDRVEGRKRLLLGRLLDGDELLAEAEGLWIELRQAGAPAAR
jgi:acyl-coenzyme A thioesterase PaaI-like protein